MTFNSNETHPNDFDPKKANTKEAKIGGTTEVGQFSPQGDSPYGCVDMAGNVWEWCNDWFNENEYKDRKDAKDPQGTQSGTSRVLRGGSWFISVDLARSALRGWLDPALASLNFGFRCARSLPVL